MKQYSIRFSQEQRQTLETFVSTGTAPARAIMHAQIMLKADSGSSGPAWSDRRIAEAFGVSERTIIRLRKRYVEQGMQAALHRCPQPERPSQRTLDGEQEAHVIAVLCHEKPQGREQWTLRLLARRVVELEIVESISHETLRQTLKKTR